MANIGRHLFEFSSDCQYEEAYRGGFEGISSVEILLLLPLRKNGK